MTREIKFRVWNKARKKMEYEDLASIWRNGWDCALSQVLPVPTIENKHEMPTWMENSVFLQFTGLKDKNGVEIYEGDILQEEKTEKRKTIESKMENNCGECGYVYGWDVPEHKNKIAESFEVIGNIHENPELIPKK